MSDAASPAPDAAAANPPHFKVGLGFVKTYYKALTESPDKLANFYKAGTSFLGHGEGSTVADPKPLEEYDLSVGRWGCSNNETMRFDFEHGAIDTQPVNGGVLLVVTAQVFFDKDGSSTKASECKDFVQTFFLAREGRNFACYNDVLRFLQFPEGKKAGGKTSTPTASSGTNTNATATADGMSCAACSTAVPPSEWPTSSDGASYSFSRMKAEMVRWRWAGSEEA